MADAEAAAALAACSPSAAAVAANADLAAQAAGVVVVCHDDRDAPAATSSVDVVTSAREDFCIGERFEILESDDNADPHRHLGEGEVAEVAFWDASRSQAPLFSVDVTGHGEVEVAPAVGNGEV